MGWGLDLMAVNLTESRDLCGARDAVRGVDATSGGGFMARVMLGIGPLKPGKTRRILAYGKSVGGNATERRGAVS
ncbi:MAG: hypothetical protein ABJF07_01835 [Nisaea sp.]|uniref:hypothetical protein n=1 Tax=Nisaea sp. TaxID=2024842 RepID=UPI00326478BA